jgi:RNA polymerase sigma-70 factor (ECF subfamily)
MLHPEGVALTSRMMSALDAATERWIRQGALGGARAREEAFQRLFTALREPVFRLCLQLTGQRADAEDAVQETFVSVLRALPAFRGESRLATWVYRIAVHAALRLRTRRPPWGGAIAPEPVLDGERAQAARDGTREILEAMERLPAEHRITLALFAIEGLRHGEIAEVLGVPEGTVWSRLHSARKRLADELRPALQLR